MNAFNFIILYVKDPDASARFYTDLFGTEPVESSPFFVMYVLPSGMRLGLWAKHTVEPMIKKETGGISSRKPTRAACPIAMMIGRGAGW